MESLHLHPKSVSGACAAPRAPTPTRDGPPPTGLRLNYRASPTTRSLTARLANPAPFLLQ